MSPQFIRYSKNLIILTVALALIMAIVFGAGLKGCYLPVFPFLLLFAFGFSLITFFLMEKASAKTFAKYVRTRMIITVLRLFTYILIAVVYIVWIGKAIPCFTIGLGLLYLVYTFFEVYMLTSKRKS